MILIALLGSTFALAGARRPAESVRISLVESPLNQAQLVRCELIGDSISGWTFFYGEVRRGEGGSWQAVRARSQCGAGTSADLLRTGQVKWRGAPYVIADVALRGPRETGKVEVSVRRRKLSSFSKTGAPSYAADPKARVVTLTGRAADLPLLVADEKESAAFGAYDVLLRIEQARAVGRATHGMVSVRSDTPGAAILVDSGIVGRTGEDATLVENVVSGERDVAVRDLSGRTARRSVTVLPGRTADVILNLRDSPSAKGTASALIPLGANPQGFDEYWRAKDGAIVVKIPDAFLIDKTEVTWRRYGKFAADTGATQPPTPLWGALADYPVNAVTWDEASAFCGWAGGRLPTEAEWERSARGTDGRKYPYGDEFDPDRCNTRDGGAHRPREVGAFPGCTSPYGLLDSAGGVWEFTSDWFDGGTSGTRLRAIRGGSWLNPESETQTTHRQGADPAWRNVLQGFRCAQDARD